MSDELGAAGFDVQSEISRDADGVVLAATQSGLGRTVAIRVLFVDDSDPSVHARFEWALDVYDTLRAPCLPSLLAAGRSEQGLWAAFLPARQAHPVEALDLLHAAGLAHGALDGVVLRHAGLGGLTGSIDAAIADDRVQLAHLVDQRKRQVRVRWLAAVGVALLLAAVLTIHLTPGHDRRVGCEGKPAPSVRGCTLARSDVVSTDGLIRRWSVTGADGWVALQVIRPVGERWRTVQESQSEWAAGGEREAFTTSLQVRRGDVLGLSVDEGATVSLVPRAGSTTLRWLGTLRYVPRSPGRAFSGAVQFDAVIEPGRRRPEPEHVAGVQAERAPAGRVVASRGATQLGRPAQRVDLVVADGRVFVDLVRGDRTRLMRMVVPLADSGGTGSLRPYIGRADGIEVQWRNPDGDLVRHRYVVRSTGLVFVD